MPSICMVRWCKGDWRLDSGNWKLETGGWKLETGDGSQKTGVFETSFNIEFGICWPIAVLKKFAYNRTKSQTGTFFGLRTSDSRLRTSDFRLPSSDFRLPTPILFKNK